MPKKKVELGRRRLLKSPGLSEYASLIVRTALQEDIGSGDITTRATVSARQRGTCALIAGEDMVVAGLFVAEEAFRLLDRKALMKANFSDGDEVKKGEVIATVDGSLRSLLTAERVALNLLQRLSGIATLTAEFVRMATPLGAKILDTRKTTPCLRALEKYAVRAGGGYNHRFGLYDSALVKDNHIMAAGGISEAVKKIDKAYGGMMITEVETTTLKEVREAIDAGADIIMLDNMTFSEMKKAVRLIGKRALVEASGGVNLSNVKSVARSGVDFISVGAVTHSARAVDISMEVISVCAPQKTRK